MITTDIDTAVAALKAGKIIAYPTEAVFGLGCDPWHAQACQNIINLKNRQRKAGLLCVVHNWSQLAQITAPLDDKLLESLQNYWPGATNWILPAAPDLPSWLVGPDQTIGVRMSAHPIVKQLTATFDRAIISTSANLQGQPPARSISAVKQYFPDELAIYLDGALGNQQQPCRIMCWRKGLIRAGDADQH